MLTINLGRGYCNIIEGRNHIRWNFTDVNTLPSGSYGQIGNGIRPDTPLFPVNDIYEGCLRRGMESEQIIDVLIRLYFEPRIFRVGHFKDLSMVVAFGGARGAGKTVGAVGTMICDYLLHGYDCWSNVPVSVRVVYRDAEKIFTTKDVEQLDLLDLEAGYYGGCLFIDEANLEVAEGTRSMSKANLAFAKAMQQTRKRNMSVIWTCQNYNWVDNRLRWQTDFLVLCSDANIHRKLAGGVGKQSNWSVFDVSGLSGSYEPEQLMKRHYVSDLPAVWQGVFTNRLFWNAYDTSLLKGQLNYIESYKRGIKERELNTPTAMYQSVADMVARLENMGIDRISASELWQANDIGNDRATQISIGRELINLGWKKRRNGQGYYYEKIV